MLFYLSKKIAIPNNLKVKCVSWSYDHGFISCGGETGLLKVLKLDFGEHSTDKFRGFSAPRSLSMNQTLEGHLGAVQAVAWNEPYQKLTSSDQNGLIIVWMLYKGSWYEEMINNRNKSVVSGMVWTCDGQKICIVYEDGAVIVGSVDGNRLWGKELKGMRLSHVEWSPDCKLILFGVLENEVHAYDDTGNYMSKVPLPSIHGVYGRQSTNAESSMLARIVGIKWYSSVGGAHAVDVPTLAIGFSNGRIQFMRNECDEAPIIVDAELSITSIEWNYTGSILSVTGKNEMESDNKKNCVKFYNPFGEIIQILKVPGREIHGSSWEREGLRIALAVDSYIFFANIRPYYNFGYFSSTLIFSLSSNLSGDYELNSSPMVPVFFCQTNCNIKYKKMFKNLLKMAAYGQFCVFAMKSTEEISGSKFQGLASTGSSSTLQLCNSIGTPVDTVTIETQVSHLVMNSSLVIASSKEAFFVWKFETPLSYVGSIGDLAFSSQSNFASLKFPFEDEARSSNHGSTVDAATHDKIFSIYVSRKDTITCINATEKILVIAQTSGSFQIYILPKATLLQTFSISCFPTRVEINSDSSKMAVLDTTGVLIIYDFQESTNNLLDFQRKDVWDFKWASDNSDMIAISEKTKMIVFNDLQPEDPVSCAGYICSFNDLTVKTALLDALIIDATNNPISSSEESYTMNEYIIEFETRSLKEARGVLEKVGISEASQFIEEVSHPRLWRLLAESALKCLDLKAAELALVRCKDYKGIQFTKRIASLPNDLLKRAEIFSYFGQFTEAENIYLDVDRRDLAIKMRKVLGEWTKVIDLLKGDLGSNDDQQMREALYNSGNYYAERQEWQAAVNHFEKCGAINELFYCYNIQENYLGLKLLLKTFENAHPLLPEIGRVLESVGMCDEAVEAYLKGNKIDQAIKCCVNFNEWKMAIHLAQEHDVSEIDTLLAQYTQHLLQKEKHFDIIELYRKANKVHEAATILLKLVDQTKKRFKQGNALLLKKICVLIGIIYEEEKKTTSKRSGPGKNTLSSLLADDSRENSFANFRAFDQPWKGAEGFHFYMLAQRQLFDGYIDAAMKTSLHLRDYEDFINEEDIYMLLALSSCANRCFAICSKAFIKLESLTNVSKEKKKDYEELAVTIFTKYPPKDSRTSTKSECTYCETLIPDWCNVCPSCNTKFQICIASGRPIMDISQQWTCSRCKHPAYISDLVSYTNCPLCHYIISTSN